MSSTFSQIYIQIVFAVKGRQSLIQQSWEEELYKYITGIKLLLSVSLGELNVNSTGALLKLNAGL